MKIKNLIKKKQVGLKKNEPCSDGIVNKKKQELFQK